MGGLVGVILAGGRGTRLDPVTRVVNKHLLPVYDRPMVCFPISTLMEAGVTDLVIVTNGPDIPSFKRVLGEARDLGARRILFVEQARAGGIADALLSAEGAVGGAPVCVVLGDNILGGSIRSTMSDMSRSPSGALLLLAEVEDARGLGVVRFDRAPVAGQPLPRVLEIVEKPESPPSRHAVTGVYFFGPDVFEVCRSVSPSARGELEITAVNNAYLGRGQARFARLEGWWTDAGTFEGLHGASRRVAQDRARGSRIGLSPGVS